MSDRFFDKLDKIEDKLDRKLDKLDRRIDSIEKELIIYNEELKRHIEGVRQAHRENELLQDLINLETQKLQNELKPIKDHVQKMQGSFLVFKTISGIIVKLIGAASILSGIAYSIYSILKGN